MLMGACLALGLSRAAPAAFASRAPLRAKPFLAIDAGFFANNFSGRVSAQAVDESKVSHFSAYLRLRGGIHIGRNVHWEPAVGTVLPWFNGNDGLTKIYTFHTDAPFLIPIFSFLKLRFGPGIEWQVVSSEASVVELGNGTAKDDFYVPEGSSTVALLTVRTGLEIRLSRRLCVNTDVSILSFANPLRRTVQLALGLGVYL
jgi:hypothetical protein